MSVVTSKLDQSTAYCHECGQKLPIRKDGTIVPHLGKWVNDQGWEQTECPSTNTKAGAS